MARIEQQTLDMVVELVCTPTSSGRETFYRVTRVLRDGTREPTPPANTVEQVQQWAREWFPNATVCREC